MLENTENIATEIGIFRKIQQFKIKELINFPKLKIFEILEKLLNSRNN